MGAAPKLDPIFVSSCCHFRVIARGGILPRCTLMMMKTTCAWIGSPHRCHGVSKALGGFTDKYISDSLDLFVDFLFSSLLSRRRREVPQVPDAHD